MIDRFGSRIVASGLCGWRVSLCSSRIACKKEHRRSSCTNALPSNNASPLDVAAAQTPNGMVNCIYESRGDVFGESRGGRLRIGVALSRPCTPYGPAHHSIYHLKIGCRHPFRKPLHFIVMSVMGVMSGIFPDTYGFWTCRSIPGMFGDRHVIVMVSVMEK